MLVGYQFSGVPFSPVPGGAPIPQSITRGRDIMTIIGDYLPGGIDVPGTGGAARLCPPGTACNGPSIQLPGGITGCLGSCSPIGGGDPRFDPNTGGGIISGDRQVGGTPGTCDTPTRAYCESMCGPGTTGAVCGSRGGCTLPNGSSGTLNKSRYYTFGDPRRGTTAGVVQPGTKCVKRRRMNPANAKASTRAARRVTAAIKHQDRLVKAMKKTMRGR